MNSEKNEEFVHNILQMDAEIQHGLMPGGQKQIQDGCLERGIFHLPEVRACRYDIEPGTLTL